jgi:hypothetical protein
MSGPHLYLYALCPAREIGMARHFLARWAPERVAEIDSLAADARSIVIQDI